jgi:folate-dependent phosphoribosylglycinamide formyltransferase PurN
MSELLNDVLEQYQRRPKTAILMSGSGSNAINLLGHSKIRDLYDIEVIATDNRDSNARSIAEENDIPYVEMHVDRFRSAAEREAYFESMANEFDSRGIEAALYAGFMKITSYTFARRFPGVNVHPADLTYKDSDGQAMFRGMQALPKMRAHTDGRISATVHVVDTPVDTGSAISVSEEIICPPDWTDDDCHKALQAREHIIYPKTLIKLGEGTLTMAVLPLKENDL